IVDQAERTGDDLVANRLANYAEHVGLSVPALAEFLGLSVGRLCALALCRFPDRCDDIERLAHYFGANPARLTAILSL
ncbi:MAG: hypothetical protein HY329_17005, partial [Chloroflexi bacterium]|nr:hypothetical protein [Chloroflexota bacterium]